MFDKIIGLSEYCFTSMKHCKRKYCELLFSSVSLGPKHNANFITCYLIPCKIDFFFKN